MVHWSSGERNEDKAGEIGRGYEEYQDKVRGKRRCPDYSSWEPEDMDWDVHIQRYGAMVKDHPPPPQKG